jgi:alpha-tubulin suppressor-like RCC1 family protein/predicted transcriptional regulator
MVIRFEDRLKFFVLVMIAAGLLTLILPSSAMASSPRIVAIDSNIYVSAALLDDGTLWTWGLNEYGILGTGNRSSSSVPVQVKISDVKAFSLGPQELIVLTGDGTIWFCGNDITGYVCDDAFPKSTYPVPIGRIEGAKSVVPDLEGDCILVLKSDGTVWELYWKDNRTVPLPLTDVVAIDADVHHVAALKDDGTVWSWGRGTAGQMGNGQFNDSTVPVKASVSDVVAISCGYDHTMAVKRDGTAWGWGDNVVNVLGNRSSAEFQATPVAVEDLRDVVAVATSGSHTVALKSDGTAWAWGMFNEGIIGNGVYSGDGSIIYPVKVIGLENIRQISASYSHSLALRGDGSLWAWGRNAEGELGNDKQTSSPEGISGEAVPVQVLIGPRANLTVNVTQKLPPIFDTRQPTLSFSHVPVIGSGENASRENWALEIGGSPLYIGLITDNAIYAYRGNDIYCVSLDGKFLWNVTIPEKWKLCYETKVPPARGPYYYTSTTIMCADKDVLYVYAPPSTQSNIIDKHMGDPDNASCEGNGWDVIAITPDGKIAWAVPLNTTLQDYDDTSLQAKNGIIYAFHSYNETVIDRNGSVLFTIPNVSDPCAIDEAGNIYVTPAASRQWSFLYMSDRNDYVDFREPTNVIDSYYPNGTLRWNKILDENIIRQSMAEDARLTYSTLPLYQNGSLYVPLRRGIMVLDTEGNELWDRHFDDGLYVLFELMPIDGDGNVYMVNVGNYDYVPNGVESFVYVISPDGKEVSPPRGYWADYDIVSHYAARDGIVYISKRVYGRIDKTSLDDLDTFVIAAYDFKNGKYLWNYSLPTSDRHSATLTDDTAMGVFGPYSYLLYGPVETLIPITPGSSPSIHSWPVVHFYPEDGRVYVEFHSASYQAPVVLGQSQCVYTSGIFVIDTGGNVLSRQQLGTLITSMAVSNGTVYYGTGDGKITATTALLGIASGVAVLAAAILFVKFIGFGYIARARSRIDRNDNRNNVMRFIAASPGCTQYEIARGLGFNLGTVRYHLMILGINHRLATYRDDVKRVRYFTNAGTFTGEQMRIISLLRREPVSKLLRALAGTQGMSNSGLSTACGLPDSDVSRLLKELTAKGITIREALPGEKPVYRIAPGLEGQIADIIRQIDTQSQSSPAVGMSLA